MQKENKITMKEQTSTKRKQWQIDVFDNRLINEPSSIHIVTRNSCHITETVICRMDCDLKSEDMLNANIIANSPKMYDVLISFMEGKPVADDIKTILSLIHQ